MSALPRKSIPPYRLFHAQKRSDPADQLIRRIFLDEVVRVWDDPAIQPLRCLASGHPALFRMRRRSDRQSPTSVSERRAGPETLEAGHHAKAHLGDSRRATRFKVLRRGHAKSIDAELCFEEPNLGYVESTLVHFVSIAHVESEVSFRKKPFHFNKWERSFAKLERPSLPQRLLREGDQDWLITHIATLLRLLN